MAVSASHRALDVHGVADLQAKLTGKRPNDATIRSYHSRGLMPSQIEPGRWAEKDIRNGCTAAGSDLHRRPPGPSATSWPAPPAGQRPRTIGAPSKPW